MYRADSTQRRCSTASKAAASTSPSPPAPPPEASSADASRARNRPMRAGRLGVPTKSCRSKRPGRVTAASSAARRLVAMKKAT
eukprot:scaffold111007_cov63-Phaeocystis_antarctica.AAC.4